MDVPLSPSLNLDYEHHLQGAYRSLKVLMTIGARGQWALAERWAEDGLYTLQNMAAQSGGGRTI